MAEDVIHVAIVRADGAILLAGWTSGSWNTADSDNLGDFAAILLDTGAVATTPPPTAQESTTTPSPVKSLASPSASVVPSTSPSVPVVPSTSSSDSSAGLNTLIIGTVLVVAVLLAVIGLCIFRRRRATTTVGSPEDGHACYPQAVTTPHPAYYPQAVTTPDPPYYPQAVTPPIPRRHKPSLCHKMPPPGVSDPFR